LIGNSEHPLLEGFVALFILLLILVLAWIAFMGAVVIVWMIADLVAAVRRRSVARREADRE